MHIYLIGYRGSGKSTVGRMLSQQLQRPFCDTDDLIEQTAGRTIRQIFDAVGEAGFRDIEHQVLRETSSASTPHVVALGGGAVLREENQRLIIASGDCVWLVGSAMQLYERISQDASSGARRPNLSSRGGYEEIIEVLAVREPIYRRIANFIVTSEGKSPDEIVVEIADWVKSHHGNER